MIDGRLRFELHPLAKRIRSRRLNIQSARAWGILAAAEAAFVLIGWFAGLPGSVVISVLGSIALVVALLVARRWHESSINYQEAANFIEQRHPDLEEALRTALELSPDRMGRYGFLQKHVIARALDHSRLHDWKKLSPGNLGWPRIAHFSTFLAVIVVLSFAAILPPAGPRLNGRRLFDGEIEVTPGNAEIQRGSTVVIAARFGRDIPTSASLEWFDADGNRQRAPMSQSLSDPVFAATLPSVGNDIEYTVIFGGSTSEAYRLTVFDLPTLVQADAALDYPDYTRLPDRRIEDTRRVSAVEGTKLVYEFSVNKPVQRAVLRSTEGEEIDLEATNPERTRFSTALIVDENKRFVLHLEDDAARVDPFPSDIRIQALPNFRPNLKLLFPRGDQRLSAIEELQLQAEASDDFGLVDYGLAFSVGAEDPTFLSLKESDSDDVQRAAFEHLLALESHGLEADDLVTWFSWAKDFAPDGNVRQTSSDLYFGEIRPFDEIFREQSGSGQQQGSGQQGPQAELLELQRQISISIWKLLKEDRTGPEFLDSSQLLADSQEQALSLLTEQMGQIRDQDVLTFAELAIRFMESTKGGLRNAVDEDSLEPLGGAWTSSQRAFQALLKMQPPEYDVAQSRDGSGGNNRNQQQLNQLEFNSEENRYQTESQAQAITSPEEREQLALLARLKELARRQDDMNDRLKELQTALIAAKDEQEREDIRRELKRLEEEQRRMIADLDETQQRMDRMEPGSQPRDTREQLQRTREEMRRSTEALESGSVSQALASGTRAKEELQQASDDMRKQSSSLFADQLRDLRRESRKLAAQQKETEQAVEKLDTEGPRALDDSTERFEMAQEMDEQRESLERLLDSVRQVTEESEVAEPGLHRQLYDLLRDQEHGGAQDGMMTSARLLRRGFVDQVRNLQPGVTKQLEELREGIERAANSVLGDETATMRFAQTELEDLSRALESERLTDESGQEGISKPGGDQSEANGGQQAGGRQQPGEKPELQPPGGTDSQIAQGRSPGGQGSGQQESRERGARGNRNGGNLEDLTQALESLAAEAGGQEALPLTGEGFLDWTDRLRTVESLLDSPEARERLSSARILAEEIRREFRLQRKAPNWRTVESGIIAPLTDVRTWLREEIARKEDPATLQPLDRDPVPERFAEAVRKYYESLGE